jgi:cytochrome oxidase Cu insertion factor (SCO1/SenC/PrrC family)
MSGKKIETESGSAKAQRGGIFRPAVLALAIVVVTLVAAAGGFFFGRAGSESADAHLPILGTAPSYELTNQLGQKVSSKTFLGKIQVVTFVDPYCTDFCPLIAVNLANFAASFRASPLGDKVVLDLHPHFCTFQSSGAVQFDIAY